MSPRLQAAAGSIAFARGYTTPFLDGLSDDEWFRMPAGVTHVAWQVGHLAIAQYFLVLVRVFGHPPEGDALCPGDFIKVFERGSFVDPDPANHPSVAGIRSTFDRVHEAVTAAVPTLPEADLDAATTRPHKFVKTKLEALNWCAHHEGIHAGQIALIRRFLGYPPIW